jgi:hypothetical protein
MAKNCNECASKGGRNVSNSYNSIPSDHISLLKPYGLDSTISGDKY